MAGTTQQLPRAVPDTLLKVQFIQRGGKLYKILLPTLLKHSDTSNANISHLATSPIVFEARNTRCVENIIRKSNEPSPFLKPVTLSPAAYKTIPLFGRGERIVDTNWLPEEADCIIQLVKSHKAFHDTNKEVEETVAPKIVSDNSGFIMLHETTNDISSLNVQKNESLVNDNLSIEYSSPTNQTVRALVDDVSKMMDEQRNCFSILKTQNVSVVPTQLEKIMPACDLKTEPLLSSNIKNFEVHSSQTNSPSLIKPKPILPFNGEKCTGAKVNPYTNKTKSFLPECSGTVKITDIQPNSSINTLTSASSELDFTSKPSGVLPNGRYLISFKENTNYSHKNETITDNSTTSVEGRKSGLSTNPGNKSTEMTVNGSIPSLSSEENLLLQEKLKNARTVKIHPHGNSLASRETANPILQASLSKINTKDFNSDKHKSKELISSAAAANPENLRIIETTAISPVPKNQMQIENESFKKPLSDTEFGVSSTTQITFPNIPAANKVMLRLQRAENPLNTCELLVEIALRDHDYALKEPYTKKADKHSNLSSEKYDKKVSANDRIGLNYTLRSVLRPKDQLTVRPRGRGKKLATSFLNSPPGSFQVESATEKQNCIELERADSVTPVKGVIKLVMPKAFSNTCTSADSTQAINRIAKLNAISDTTYQTPQTNSDTTQCKYIKPQISFSAVNSASSVAKDNEESSSQSDSSIIDEEFNMIEPEVLITESKGTFIFQDGKLKFCPPRKRVSKKRNFKKLPNKSEEKRITNQVHCGKTPSKHVINDLPDNKTVNEVKPVTDDLPNKETSKEEIVTNHIHRKETSNASLKRTGKELRPVQKTKCQRDALLPPSPKVRKLFICRTEKAASSLLQSCFVWLDKMDEQFLNDGRLDTAEISEDILFSLNNTSQTCTKSRHCHKRYESKAAYLDEHPIVIIEPSKGESDVNKQNDSSCIEKTVERKETNSRMADVLRLLEEKRKAIEAIRQKHTSFTLSSTISQK